MDWAVFIKSSFHCFLNFIYNLILFRILERDAVTETWSLLLQKDDTGARPNSEIQAKY